MYPLHAQWLAEQAMDRRYDPDHLDRGPVFDRPAATTGTGTLSRLLTPVTRFRAATETWIRRSSLGPLPDRCAGDPAWPGR